MKRRQFLQTSIAGLIAPNFIAQKSTKRRLCFNTLGCPDWTWTQIIQNAKAMGYAAIEIRGIKTDLDILKSPVFSASNIQDSKRLAQENGIKILNLNPSANLHEFDKTKRKANLDEAKNYIELAEKLDCPFVRVFPDKFLPEYSKAANLENMHLGLVELTAFAKGSGVKVLLDAHGDLVYPADIQDVLSGIRRKRTGIIWDFFNMHVKTRQSAAEMYKPLKSHIDLVQIKDGFFRPDGKYEYTMPGKGKVPVTDILKLIDDDGYDGFISFEWEKRWHPELAEPEVALPAFVDFMKNF